VKKVPPFDIAPCATLLERKKGKVKIEKGNHWRQVNFECRVSHVYA